MPKNNPRSELLDPRATAKRQAKEDALALYDVADMIRQRTAEAATRKAARDAQLLALNLLAKARGEERDDG
jgi:hypothetical protein